MPKRFVRAALGSLLIVIVAFLIYKMVGSPPVPLPVFHYTLREKNQVYNYLVEKDATVTITAITNGKVVVTEDKGQILADLTFTPKKLYNLTTLGERMVLPRPVRWRDRALLLFYPLYKIGFTTTSAFLYYVIPVKVTLIINAE